MVILIDMDDTIELLMEAWLRVINERYGYSTRMEEVTEWDVAAAFPDLTWEQVYCVPDEPGFWGTVSPMEGAPEAIRRFMDAGHEVYIVTATTYKTITEKMDDLLFRWFPYISWDQVIITNHKQLIRGDVLIDDGVHNLEGGDYVKILMTAHHNLDYDAEANGMIRVSSWDEIEDIIWDLQNGYTHSTC
ncbi:MAG: hypothetical protein IJJ16_01550 [Mogibacterium sp.]|nr:hypothetical protein [Mogibacterium sp.]